MGVQRIEATGFQMTAGADGNACLTLSSGTGTFEVYLKAEVWAQLGETAKWFVEHVSESDRIAALLAERDAALTAQRSLMSDLKQMTRHRNELAEKLATEEEMENADRE